MSSFRNDITLYDNQNEVHPQFAVFFLLVPTTIRAAEPPKNIVLILTDDVGWADTTLYGKTSLYETPSIRFRPTGRQPFLANAKVRTNGPLEVSLRMRTQKDGIGRIQWRTEVQASFPKTGQFQSFEVAGGDWQDLTIPLDVKGRIVHVRLFLSDSKRPTEIDWIEIGSNGGNDGDRKRWDFKKVINESEVNEPSSIRSKNKLGR